MELSILILNYKSRGLLRQCLQGVLAHPPPVPFELVVVDNGSADGTAAMVRRDFPEVRLLALSANLGYARGSNLGLQQTTGRFILLLNPDIVVPERSLAVLWQYLHDHADVGIAAPRLLNPDQTIQYTAFRWHRWLTPFVRRTALGLTKWGRRELARFLILDWDHASERAVDWLMSSCMLVRREALAEIGTFDERFFVYFADTDFCRRMWLGGWRVMYAPAAVFTHYYHRESSEDWGVAVIHVRDWLRYLWKWRGKKTPLTTSGALSQNSSY